MSLERIFEMNEWQRIQHKLAEKELALEYFMDDIGLNEAQRDVLKAIIDEIVALNVEAEEEART
jgi:hypothetical protein